MHTALISFAVYEQAERIIKFNIVIRLQNMGQELHPTVPTNQAKLGTEIISVPNKNICIIILPSMFRQPLQTSWCSC